MKRRLPPFAAVRAFEAAARHLSFTRAGEELCLTQSAVSHQVRSLEDFLGTQLFRRHAHRVELTAAGETYLGELTAVLDRLDSSTRHAGAEGAAPLRIRGTPAFIARWLVPRMHRFFGRHPEIELLVSTGLPPTDFSRDDTDVVVHWGAEPVSGAGVEPFLESARAPVAAPGFLRRGPELGRPADLLQATLLHDQVQDGWDAWFRSLGVPAPEAPRGPRFAHCDLVLTAAESGQGVALAYTALIERELAAGRLVRLFAHETPPVVIYSLAYPDSLAEDARVLAFREWIFAETGNMAKTGDRAKTGDMAKPRLRAVGR